MKNIDIEHIAALSKLKLSEEEKKQWNHEFSEFISFVSEIFISECEMEQMDYQSIDELREDITGESLSRDRFMEQTPNNKDGYVLIPRTY